MSKIISFSLWGNQPIYLQGAIRNAELCPEIYPGWTARFHVAGNVPPAVLRRLEALEAEIIRTDEPPDWRGTFWRFAPAADSKVEAMLSRDCDSRLTRREAAAVGEWMASAAEFHIMRDHPWHETEILGGMWGAKHPLLHDLTELMRRYPRQDRWQSDQDFLREVVYPRVKDVAMVHDEFFDGSPFPVRRRWLEFVGQVHGGKFRATCLHKLILAKALLLRRWKPRPGRP
jgi:hypothetical protein